MGREFSFFPWNPKDVEKGKFPGTAYMGRKTLLMANHGISGEIDSMWEFSEIGCYL